MSGFSIGLAIHTSSNDLGLAISQPDGPERIQTWELGRGLSTHFHAKLSEFIAAETLATLQFIAVAQGPGSFTSTRLGITVARTLAQQLNLPLFGISSLGAIAAAHFSAPDDSQKMLPLAITLPAQRGEVHVGIYADPYDLSAHTTDRVLSAEVWAIESQNYRIQPAPEAQSSFVLQVLTISQRAYEKGERPQWWQVSPSYGQHPVTV